ncbi:MAG TPA: oligosaccharide flippase family protein [Armatimonadota bacterium]|nr:oligosaccharide flippase family protein [Armatimonadota bacterium]
MHGIKRRAAISLLSSYASQFATTGANLLTKLILARLIAPEDLGLYALALLVLLGGDVLVDLGISQHIIREKHRPYGNFLGLRLAISVGLFATIQFAAPALKFWGGEFPAVVRLMAITLVIKAASGVPLLFLDRELLIHRSVAPQIARITIMGLVSIGLAYFGYGVWALAWGTVASEAAFAVLIWNAARGRMPLEFTWKHTGSLIWGSKFLFFIGVMGFALQQGDVGILGSLLPAREIGFYTMAIMLIMLVSKVVESAVFRVIYPMFCEYSDDLPNLGRAYRCATLAIYVIEVPIYFFLLFNSPAVVSVLLGRKWLPAAVLMQALSVFGMLNPFSTFGNEVLRARKRDSILTMSTAIGAVTLMTTGYLLTLRFGTMGMVAAHYIMIGSIPTIVTVFKMLRTEFTRLAVQLAVIYSGSFAVIGAVSMSLSFAPYFQALAAGLLVPVSWYTYYRIFGNGAGRAALDTILARQPAPRTEAAG